MMANTITAGFVKNFLGNSPQWFKLTILAFLVLNPILLIIFGPYVVGWILVLEFIFTLAMALKCYPLLPGGLLAIQSVFIGLTSPVTVLHEVKTNLEVILLLIFMVAGIYFMQSLLLFLFTKVLIKVRNKIALSLIFCLMGAILSAFLDALTVTAVVIAVSVGFYSVYHKVASGKDFNHAHDHTKDAELEAAHRHDLEQFRSFLRSLVMHAAIGTALGGVCTLVGEPQNLLIAKTAGWDFLEFLFRMSPITLPVLFAGLLTCVFVEKVKICGYGATIPNAVFQILKNHDEVQTQKRTKQEIAALLMQGAIAGWLVIALIFHMAEVGLIGLSVIVLCTAFNGVTEESQIGKAFEEALPFTALLVVFFVIVAVIQDQGLFTPIINFVLSLDGLDRIAGFYIANGVLSMISDNVFVATVYINQVKDALAAGAIDRDTFDLMAVAINTGTNIPSVATPNGQAAFLFLLTSALAPLIRLSYMKMVVMALPYTIVMSIVGLMATYYLLTPMTQKMYEKNIINHHSASTTINVPQH